MCVSVCVCIGACVCAYVWFGCGALSMWDVKWGALSLSRTEKTEQNLHGLFKEKCWGDQLHMTGWRGEELAVTNSLVLLHFLVFKSFQSWPLTSVYGLMTHGRKSLPRGRGPCHRTNTHTRLCYTVWCVCVNAHDGGVETWNGIVVKQQIRAIMLNVLIWASAVKHLAVAWGLFSSLMLCGVVFLWLDKW